MVVQNSTVKNPSVFAFWAGLGVVILAAVALRAKFLAGFPLSPDEGIHLIWLRLLSAGYRPYSEVYITYPPLYPLAIEAVWKLWPTEAAQRWFSVAYAVFGAVGIALTGRKFAGGIAGVSAAALTLFSPVVFEASRAVLGEFPSVAWSVWAVFFAWLSQSSKTRKRYLLLAMSGLCLSASLLTKLLSPFVAALIPLILLLYRRPDGQPAGRGVIRRVGRPFFSKQVWGELAVWGLAVLLPLVILVSVYDIRPLIGQVVEQRLKARTVYMADDSFWPPRLERGALFLQDDPALVILAVVGIGFAWRRRRDFWLMAVWLGLALGMLAVHNPIRYKHFLILIPPLTIFAGVVFQAVVSHLKTRFFSPNPSSGQRPAEAAVAIAGTVLLAGLYLWQIPAAFNLWQSKAGIPQPPPDEVEALAFITDVTAPGDCLITDDMQLAYWSGRMVPPELAEVSSNRLKSAALTLEELVRISDAYDCQLVAAVSNRIPKYLPGYMDWVKGKYLGMFHYGEDDLFFAKADTDPNPASPLRASFAGQIIFHGYTLDGLPAHPGSRLPLTLVWQAAQTPAQDYAIFVQLRDSQHAVLASADHQPYKGYLPTSRWPAGAVVQEVTWLNLPRDIPPGSYNLYVGLYHPATGERLPLLNDISGENALLLTPVEVGAR